MKGIMKKEDNRYEAPTITQQADGRFTIASLPGSVIRYTTNGHAPTEASPMYGGQPIEVTVQQRGLKAKSWLGDEDSKIATFITRLSKTLNLNVYVVDPTPPELRAPKPETEKKGKQSKQKKIKKEKKEKTAQDILRDKVFAAIRKYRHVAESAVNRIIAAESALAVWNDEKDRVDRPSQKDVRLLLGEIYQKQTGNPIEAYIKELAPEWLYHLIQGCTRMIDSTLAAHDAENPKLTRRDMIHGHARNPPRFNYVGLPILCSGQVEGNICWHGLHRLSLKWDKELGPVEFGLVGKKTESGWGQDPYQIDIIKKIQSGEYQQGTSQLTENDGQIVLAVTYSFIPQQRERDQSRVLEIVFTDDREKFLKAKLHGSSTHRSAVDLEWSEAASAVAAIDHIQRLKIQSDHIENIREACGSHRERKRGAGVPAAWRAARDRSERLSKARNNTVKTWNHRWTSQIVNWAISRDCGVVKVFGVPKLLFGWQWQFADFRSKLQYKADAESIEIVIQEDLDIEISPDGAVSLAS